MAAARGSLRAFIRGIGWGDPSVCDKYATADYQVRTYGSVDKCHADANNVEEWYRPEEVKAMRTTSVHGGSTSGNSVVFYFQDLSWTSGHMTYYTVQKKFVLRQVNGTWKIVG